MAKSKVLWNKHPDSEDFTAASRYLELVYPPAKMKRIIRAYRGMRPTMFAAKDLLRASSLPLLPDDETHVDADLKRIRKGKRLAPVILVRGNASDAAPLTIADGYHRICAVCYIAENEPIPCLLVSS
jgi:hypothetical protein